MCISKAAFGPERHLAMNFYCQDNGCPLGDKVVANVNKRITETRWRLMIKAIPKTKRNK